MPTEAERQFNEAMLDICRRGNARAGPPRHSVLAVGEGRAQPGIPAVQPIRRGSATRGANVWRRR